MTNHETDRRVQRTRRLLQEACVDLILEKGYGEVTIQDILDRADVGRSTFYAHYRDKEDLVMSRFESVFTAFEEHMKLVLESDWLATSETDPRVNLPLAVMKYVEHEHRLVKALLGEKSGGMYLNRVRTHLVKYTRDILRNFAKANLAKHQLEAVTHYVANSFLALVMWWVDDDLPCTADELYSILQRLLEPGLTNVLEVPLLWSQPLQPPNGR